MFYLPRLFIYATEAGERVPMEREVLRKQFGIMIRRLWFGITWPSAILTLLLGPSLLWMGNWYRLLWVAEGQWLLIKLVFVVLLYAYHWSLHLIVRQQLKGIYRYTSQQLRIWNEVATVFLIAIVMLVVVKQSISLVWGLAGLVLLILLLMSAIRIYKYLRKQ